MKKILSIFIMIAFAMPVASYGAITVKKAPTVSVKKTEKMESATSLLPTVIGLYGSVKNLKAQQQQLEADCVPTSDEITTVNNLVKEWAKIGDTDADSAVSGLGEKCSETPGSSGDAMLSSWLEYEDNACYVTFALGSGVNNTTVNDMIWKDYPMVTTAKKCDPNNNKNCTTISNLYDIFVKLPFSEEDYTEQEAKKVAKLIEKSERCAPSKITAAKRQLWSGFVTQTIGSVGQTAGVNSTGSILETVSSMGGSADFKSMLPTLSTGALQMFNQ